MEEETRGIAALERQVLQKRIGEPLATVQTLMQRDKVAWSSGVLATPPVSGRIGFKVKLGFGIKLDSGLGLQFGSGFGG